MYLAIASTIMAELVFTTYLTLFEKSNFIGHYLKLISCWFIYKAVVEIGIAEPNQLLYHKLQQSRELYRLLAENCGDIIWRMDQNGKTVYTSPGLKKLEPEDLEERFNEDSQREMQNVFQEMKNAEDRKERLIELRELTKNGREIYTETSLSPVYSGSEFDGVVAVTRDITDRKRFEEYLHNLIQEQQELNLKQKEFNACLTHELRTPISGIIGLVDMVFEAYPDKKCLDYLSDLSLSTSHLHSLVNNVLDLSKLESGSFQIHQDICSLKDLISFLDKNITPSLNPQVDFKIEMSEEVPDFIKTDALRLRQILLNLLNNSTKFTEKGRVDLVIRLKKAGVLFFEISDTGSGIPPEMIDNIFTKYCSIYQSGQKKSSPGTGLGLYIAHVLSGLMGEAVKVDSEPGRGSRFYFSINFESVTQVISEAETVEMPEEKQPDFVPLEILVAEDERINRMVLEKILISCGHAVVMVNNGEELLDKLREKNNFDLIMTDIEMPVIDGIELTKTIRQCTDGSFDANIPIIAMTAHSSEDVFLMLREIGITEVFTKPHNLEKIRSFLQKYMKKAA
jgi:PAS domain S-box-containing protein